MKQIKKTYLRSSLMGGIAALVIGLTSCASTGTGGSATGSAKPYTLDTCLVTDNALGSMGDPVSIVHEGQEVKFCCKPCVAKFKADPQKYLSKL